MLDTELLNEFQDEFKRVTKELNQQAKDALDETKRFGDMHQDTKASVDKLLSEQGVMAASISELTQTVASRRGGEEPNRQTLGDMVSAHADIRSFAERGATGSVRIGVSNAITSAAGSAGALIAPQRESEIVSDPRRKMTIKDLITVGETSSNLVIYARQTGRIGQANTVPDDGVTAKPELSFTWGAADAPVRTIAGITHIHKHTLDDVLALRTELDTELRYAIDLAEEIQIISGDGTEDNLLGLVSQARPYGQTAREPAGVTSIDRLRLAMLQISLAGYVVDGHVLNSIDWALMEILKDSQNRYIFGDPTQSATPRLWGRPVVDTVAIPEDKFLTGAFKLAATLYERQETEVLISSEHGDNFIKNMLTVRAEKRAALAVKRPFAMVYGDFGRVA